jgi:hypothetical protein
MTGALRVDGKVERESSREPVQAGQILSRRRGRNLDVMAGLPLRPNEVGDLNLDPPETRQVAVTDVKDPHRVRLAECETPIKRQGPR